MLKCAALSIALLLCVGCNQPNNAFVQNGIRIVPPVTQDGTDLVSKTVGEGPTVGLFLDGGTKMFKITDAERKKFDVYVDGRFGSATRGAIWLNDYPGKTNSVLVVNQKEFREKIGRFDLQ